MKYEHRIIHRSPYTNPLGGDDLDYLANEQGWLLISAISPNSNSILYIFRREVKENR